MTNENEMRMKWCKGCDNIKPITEYYKAGKSYQTRCKPCHIKQRQHDRLVVKIMNKSIVIGEGLPKERKKRDNGFQQLPQEKQDELLKYLDTMPMTKLAEKIGVNKNTLASWKKRGHLVK